MRVTEVRVVSETKGQVDIFSTSTESVYPSLISFLQLSIRWWLRIHFDSLLTWHMFQRKLLHVGVSSSKALTLYCMVHVWSLVNVSRQVVVSDLICVSMISCNVVLHEKETT